MISPKQEKWMARFGMRLKLVREACGYRVGEVEDKLGLARDHLGRVERGRGTPNIWFLRKVSRFYQVSPSWLLGVSSLDGLKPEAIKPRIRHFIKLPNRKDIAAPRGGITS